MAGPEPTAPARVPFDHTKLAAARLRAAGLQPFLAIALYALSSVADYSRPTFAVDDRWRLYVNPVKLADWTVLEVAGVLLHEVGHVVRDHSGRARVCTDGSEVARHRWNVAADAEINDDLAAADIALPEKPVTPRSLGMPPNKVAEFYYSKLTTADEPPPADLDCGSGCHGQEDAAALLPSHVEPLPAGLSETEAMLLRRRVAEAISMFAAARAGQLAGGWLRWAEATLRPQLDWRKLLGAKIRSSAAAIAGAADYSYSRPARRQVPHVVLPSLRRPIPRVGVIIDTSASVSDEGLATAWTEVHGCLRALGVRRDLLTVYAADTQVHRLTGAPRRQVNLTGGGGTDMATAVESVLADTPAPDLIIVITDGLTPWPTHRPRQQVIIVQLPLEMLTPPPAPSWAQVVRVPE